ncbi:hypothetical protein H5410_026492 [Solanum commersonii]|uniref:Uncharacterized protein n=1 Tax=Solanum commersonii TaxID=4109 RepID=A0A9J5YZ02_SOLCO|nr:hypothetical protein H5410_026492 [Solanum commersonii]
MKQTLIQFYHVPLALFVGPRNIQNPISTLKIDYKGKLKEWSKNEQGNLKIQRSKLLSQMEDLDSLLDGRALTEEESVKNAVALMDFEELDINEEIAWRQKSRIDERGLSD